MNCFARFSPSLKDSVNITKINFISNLFFFRYFSIISLIKFDIICAFNHLNRFIRELRVLYTVGLGLVGLTLANVSLNIGYYRFKCPTRGSALKGGINTYLKGKKTVNEAYRGTRYALSVESGSPLSNLYLNFINRSGDTHLLILNLC